MKLENQEEDKINKILSQDYIDKLQKTLLKCIQFIFKNKEFYSSDNQYMQRIKKSNLSALFQFILNQNNLTEILKKNKYFQTFFDILNQISINDSLLSLYVEREDDKEETLFEKLYNLQAQSQFFINNFDKMRQNQKVQAF